MSVQVIRAGDGVRGEIEFGAAVELDVDDEVRDWAVLDGGASDSVEARADGIRIVGTVAGIGVGDDPVVTFRVRGTLVMVEADRELRRELSIGATVAFTTPEIRLCPYDV